MIYDVEEWSKKMLDLISVEKRLEANRKDMMDIVRNLMEHQQKQDALNEESKQIRQELGLR